MRTAHKDRASFLPSRAWLLRCRDELQRLPNLNRLQTPRKRLLWVPQIRLLLTLQSQMWSFCQIIFTENNWRSQRGPKADLCLYQTEVLTLLFHSFIHCFCLISSRLSMRRRANCRLWSIKPCKLWAAALTRTTGEARWRRLKRRSCCWFPVRTRPPPLSSDFQIHLMLSVGWEVWSKGNRKKHLSSTQILTVNLIFFVSNYQKQLEKHSSFSRGKIFLIRKPCQWEWLVGYNMSKISHLSFLKIQRYNPEIFALCLCLVQVRNVRLCWQKWPGWGRRGVQCLRRQQRRTATTFPSSPAEELSTSPTSSCRWRWSLSVRPRAEQVDFSHLWNSILMQP